MKTILTGFILLFQMKAVFWLTELVFYGPTINAPEKLTIFAKDQSNRQITSRSKKVVTLAGTHSENAVINSKCSKKYSIGHVTHAGNKEPNLQLFLTKMLILLSTQKSSKFQIQKIISQCGLECLANQIQ